MAILREAVRALKTPASLSRKLRRRPLYFFNKIIVHFSLLSSTDFYVFYDLYAASAAVVVVVIVVNDVVVVVAVVAIVVIVVEVVVVEGAATALNVAVFVVFAFQLLRLLLML